MSLCLNELIMMLSCAKTTFQSLVYIIVILFYRCTLDISQLNIYHNVLKYGTLFWLVAVTLSFLSVRSLVPRLPRYREYTVMCQTGVADFGPVAEMSSLLLLMFTIQKFNMTKCYEILSVSLVLCDWNFFVPSQYVDAILLTWAFPP